MNSLIYEKLRKEFGPIHWVQIPNHSKIIAPGDWLLARIKPIPLREHLRTFVNICIEEKTFCVDKGKLTLDVDDPINEKITNKAVEKVLNKLEDPIYEIMIYLNTTEACSYQPLVFSINPLINYLTYPTHPHINCYFNDIKVMQGKYFFPQSICYNDANNSLGDTEYEIIKESLWNTSLWHFRHRIWEETQNSTNKGIWIGPNKEYFDNGYNYLTELNPYGLCRCGRNKKYYECCMEKDLKELDKISKNILNPNYRKAELRTSLYPYRKYHSQMDMKSRKFLQYAHELFSKYYD